MARLVKQATRNVQLASSARLVARAKPARVEADAIIVQIMLGLRQMEPSCRVFNGIYKCTVALVLTGFRLVLVKAATEVGRHPSQVDHWRMHSVRLVSHRLLAVKRRQLRIGLALRVPACCSGAIACPWSVAMVSAAASASALASGRALQVLSAAHVEVLWGDRCLLPESPLHQPGSVTAAQWLTSHC